MRLHRTALLAVLFALVAANAARADSGATPAVDRAVAAVHDAAPNGNPAGQAAALRLYIHRTVNPLKLVAGGHPATADGVLGEGSGACGNQTQAYLAVAARLGLRARPVEFYERPTNGPRASHIVPEVFWAGSWHLEDITWNTVYRRTAASSPLSAAALVALTPKQREQARRTGRNAFPAALADYRAKSGDPFAYIHGPADVVVDHTGTVAAELGDYPRPNVPGYIGRTMSDDGVIGNLRLHLTGLTGDTVTVTGSAGCGAGTLVAQSAVRDSVAVTGSTFTLRVAGGTVDLSVEAEGVCYLAVDAIR